MNRHGTGILSSPGGDAMTVEALSSTADLEDAREQLLQSFAGLDETLLTEPKVVGEWSIRDVVAHIATWDTWVRDVLDADPKGEAPAEPDEESMNRQAQERFAGTPLEVIRREMRTTRMPILCQFASMSDEDRARPRYAMGDKTISADDLAESFIEHDRSHASEIRAWRKLMSV